MSLRHIPLLLAPFALGSAACATGTVTVPETPINVDKHGEVYDTYNQEKKPLPALDCPVTIQLESRGYVLDHEWTRIISEEACTKLDGESAALPTKLQLWYSTAGFDDYQICQEDNIKDTKHAKVKTCLWNGRYRHTYPFNFIIRSKRMDGASVVPLAKQVKAIRIFLNGDLAWKWVPSSTETQPTPTETYADIVAPGRDIRRRLLPEGARMDLRIIPHDVMVDQALLDAKVAEKHEVWKQQLELMGNAVLTSNSFAEGKLKEKLGCITYRAKEAAYLVGRLGGGKGLTAPTLPSGCEAVPPADIPNSLTARYAGLKVKTQQEVDALVFGFRQEVLALKGKVAGKQADDKAKLEQAAKDFWAGTGDVWKGIDSAAGTTSRDAKRAAFRKKIDDDKNARAAVASGAWKTIWKAPKAEDNPTPTEVAWLEMIATGNTVKDFVDQADRAVTQALGGFQSAIDLAEQLQKDVLRFANSTDEQAQLLLRVANSVQGTSPFEQMKDNPDLIHGEKALGMRYSDHWQWFLFAPWTAFPAGLSGKVDFTAANLVPIVDVIGYRYQWQATRFADIRAGIGFTALSFSTPDASKSATDPNATTNHFLPAPEVNIGIANFKLGMAFALAGGSLTNTCPANTDCLLSKDRWRFLIGADLYKLISGNNVEAAAF
jgi:hypothetical protein